jgi:hypothetical protein
LMPGSLFPILWLRTKIGQNLIFQLAIDGSIKIRTENESNESYKK